MNSPRMRPTGLRLKYLNPNVNTTRLLTLSTWAPPIPVRTATVPLLRSSSLYPLRPRPDSYSPRCRFFSSTTKNPSGHSRWSKIKHDKAAKDKGTAKTRTALARELTTASKLGGSADPLLNPRLPSLIALAKKIGFPKTSIASAIARGQGRSSTGAALEYMTLEGLHTATGVAIIVECATDNKARTLQTVREIMKLHGAGEGSVEWMFERKGRVAFEKKEAEEEGAWDKASGEGTAGSDGIAATSIAEARWDEDDILDKALEAGAMDVDFDSETGRNFDLVTEPSDMQSVADAMAKAIGQAPARTELAWISKPDMMVELVDEPGGSEQRKSINALEKMVNSIEEDEDIAGVWLNRS